MCHALLVNAQVVGSAIAISLLTYGAVPLWAGVIITAVASFVLLLLERLGVRWLEALFAVFIGLMAVAFGVMYVLAGVPTARVLEGADPAAFPAHRMTCLPCLSRNPWGVRLLERLEALPQSSGTATPTDNSGFVSWRQALGQPKACA